MAVRQQEPGPLEGPVREVGAECLIEAVGSLLVILGEERARVQQPHGDAGSCDVASGCLDLPHARSCFLDLTGMHGGFGEIAD